MNSYFNHEIISIPKAPPSGGGCGDKSTPPNFHMAYSGFPALMLTLPAHPFLICHMTQWIA